MVAVLLYHTRTVWMLINVYKQLCSHFHALLEVQCVENRRHEGALWRDLSGLLPPPLLPQEPFHDRWSNRRNTGDPPMSRLNEAAGSRVRVRDHKHKSGKLGKRLRKVQLAICTCLPANCLQWAAFVQWPMQLEWRLLSKSSCRAPDKRIKNYDIF